MFFLCIINYSSIINQTADDVNSNMRVLSSGTIQQAQLLMDPTTGQHYIIVPGNNGAQQLIPVQVRFSIS